MLHRTAAVLLIALAAVLMSVIPAHALGSSVSPDIGPPGQTFNFNASGFAPNELVRVAFETPDRGIIRFADAGGIDIPVIADAGGVARWSYTVPTNFSDGVYVAVAAGAGNAVTRRTAFLVQTGATARDVTQPEAVGQVAVRPTVGPPGGIFVFRTDGFQPRERVAIWLHAPDGGISDLTVGMTQRGEYYADPRGHLEWVVVTSTSTPDGRYAAVALGVNSGTLRVALFTVQQGAGQMAPLPTENTFVNPVSGPPGTRFAFTATGFFPSEGIGIWIHRPGGGILTISADGQAVKADAAGIATWSITANQSLADGVYTMVAQGMSSTIVRAVRFEIRR